MLTLLALAACGPQVSDDPTTDDPTGSTSDSTTTAASVATTDEPGSSSGAAGESSETGTPAECDGYDNEAIAGETSIEFRNETEETLLLEVNCGRDYLSITNDLGWRWPGDFCGTTCAELFEFGCQVCDGCAEGAYQLVSPGATLSIPWAGQLYEGATPPATCLSEGSFCNGGNSCQVGRNAASGEDVRVRIVAARQSACEAVSDDPTACTCPKDEPLCDGYLDGDRPPVVAAEYIADAPPGGVIEVVATD